MATPQKLAPRRYLALFSYVGTNYSGIQRDLSANLKYKCVTEVLNEGLSKFNKKKLSVVPQVRTASRTDIGVHALQNAFTFDTTDDINRIEYEPQIFKLGLNHYFQLKKEQILINQLYQTKDPLFNCRAAPIERTYLYKIMLVDQRSQVISPMKLFYQKNSWVMDKQKFDIEKFKEGCSLFEGRHCFRHFVKINKLEPDPFDYWRTINSIKVYEREPELYLPSVSQNNDLLLVIEIKSRSFLWHQIRIMMRAIVDYSEGKISKEQIEDLQTGEEPMADKYPKYMKAQAEAAGLYLAKIKYDLDDIILHTSMDQTDKSVLENS